jgi:hypothetical protein
MLHELKTLPSFYEPILHGLKRFEIRKNDRNFEVGDFLLLKEWDGDEYTGRELTFRVSYLTDFQQKSGYVVMGIVPDSQ